MPFTLKAGIIYIGIYVLGLAFSFVSEVAYKKRTIQEVRQDWKKIVIQASIIFAVFVVASIVWGIFGLKRE